MRSLIAFSLLACIAAQVIDIGPLPAAVCGTDAYTPPSYLCPDSGNCVCTNPLASPIGKGWHPGNPYWNGVPTRLRWRIVSHGFSEIMIPTRYMGTPVVDANFNDNSLPWCQNRRWGWYDAPPFTQNSIDPRHTVIDYIPPSAPDSNYMYTAWASYATEDIHTLRALGFTCLSHTTAGRGKWVGPKAAAKQPILPGVTGNTEPDLNSLKVLNDGLAPCRSADVEWCSLAGAYPEGLPADDGAPTGGHIWTDDIFSCGSNPSAQTCTGWDSNQNTNSPLCTMNAHRWNYDTSGTTYTCANSDGVTTRFKAVSKNNLGTVMETYATKYGWQWWTFHGCSCRIGSSPRQYTGAFFENTAGGTVYNCTTPCSSVCNGHSNICYRDGKAQLHCACEQTTTEAYSTTAATFGYTCEKSCLGSCNGKTPSCIHNETSILKCTSCGSDTFGTFCEKSCSDQCNGHATTCDHDDLALTGSDPCRCAPGYFGPKCEYNANGICLMANLPGGGTLKSDFYYDNGFVGCNCKAGFYGRDCSLTCASACLSNLASSAVTCSQDAAFRPICPCSGHGDIDPATLACRCVDRYFGAQCETRFSTDCNNRIALPYLTGTEDQLGFNGITRPTVSSPRGAHSCPAGSYLLITDPTSYTDDFEGCFCPFLARDPRTRLCTAGATWDSVFTRRAGENNQNWRWRIVKAYTGATVPFTSNPFVYDMGSSIDLSLHYAAICDSLVSLYGFNEAMCQPFGTNITSSLFDRFSVFTGGTIAQTVNNGTLLGCWRHALVSVSATRAIAYDSRTGRCDIYTSLTGLGTALGAHTSYTFRIDRATYDTPDVITVNGVDRTMRYRSTQCPQNALGRANASAPCFCSRYLGAYNETSRRCEMGAWTNALIRPSGADLTSWHALISKSLTNGTIIIPRNVIAQTFSASQVSPFGLNYLDLESFTQYCIEFCSNNGASVRAMVDQKACDCSLSPARAIVPIGSSSGIHSSFKAVGTSIGGWTATSWWICMSRCYNELPLSNFAYFDFPNSYCSCFAATPSITAVVEKRSVVISFNSIDYRMRPSAFVYM